MCNCIPSIRAFSVSVAGQNLVEDMQSLGIAIAVLIVVLTLGFADGTPAASSGQLSSRRRDLGDVEPARPPATPQVEKYRASASDFVYGAAKITHDRGRPLIRDSGIA